MKNEIIVFDFDGTLFHLQAKWSDLTDDNREEVESKGAGQRTIDPRIVAGIKDIQDQYYVAIYSKNLKTTIDKVLERSGLTDIFVAARDNTPHLKPHTDGLDMIEEFYQAKIKFIVGDTTADIQAARNFGCPVTIVCNPKLDFVPQGADNYLEELFPYEEYYPDI